MISIVALGDNCVDIYEDGRKKSGGCALNVSCIAKSLGVLSGFIGAFGKDENRDFILHEISDYSLDLSHIKILDGPTATIEVKHVNGRRVYLNPKPGVLMNLILNESDYSYIHGMDVAVCSIYSRIDYAIPRIAKETNVAYDFSDGPIGNKLLPYLTYVFCSRVEDTCSLRSEMKTIGQKVPYVIATLGKRGSLVFSDEKFYFQEAKKVEVVDDSGAGDSYLAAFLVSILNQDEIPIAMKKATEKASETLMKLGPR